MTIDTARGRIIGGKYRLIEPIGAGGMAVVWRAEMGGTGKAAGLASTVAVKKMNAGLRAERNCVAMFMEEARVGTELRHPNIVKVFDFCRDNDGLGCLVMEYVDGIHFRRLIDAARTRGQRLPWALVAAIGAYTLRGLAAAHERRTRTGLAAPIIHRDISPSNILLAANGTVKLADFGLARARDRLESFTAPGIIKGKLAYMAPEIALGAPATAQSDLYAMGCVLWEALSGRPLFPGQTPVEVLRKVQRGQVRPLADQREDLPPRLITTVDRALAFRPDHRFRSARDMSSILTAIVACSDMPGDVHRALARVVREVGAGGVPDDDDLTWSNDILELSVADLEQLS
jgi:serine/threonine protein kinase